MKITIIPADLANEEHCQGLLAVLDDYARELRGGAGLSVEAFSVLPEQLRAQPGCHIFLALSEPEPGHAGRGPRPVPGATVVGAAVCLRGFSTFAGRPLLNVHDLAVRSAFRGHGIGQQLLEAVASAARALGCCRVTLEVDSSNPAKRLYERAGFVPSQEFWRKEL